MSPGEGGAAWIRTVMVVFVSATYVSACSGSPLGSASDYWQLPFVQRFRHSISSGFVNGTLVVDCGGTLQCDFGRTRGNLPNRTECEHVMCEWLYGGDRLECLLQGLQQISVPPPLTAILL